MRYTGLIAVLVCSMNMTAAADSDKFPGVKSLMTEEEVQATGLSKLSEKEIEALNAWLVRYTANEASILKREVAEIQEEADKEIRGRIDGEFNGWSGKTVFRLQNGQVWQQRYSGKWSTQLIDPEVVISRNFFGFYEMTVVGSKRSIGVKRIR